MREAARAATRTPALLEIKTDAGTAAASSTTAATTTTAAAAEGAEVPVIAALEEAHLDALAVEFGIIEVIHSLSSLLLVLVRQHCRAAPHLHLDLAVVVELLLEDALVGLEVQVAHEDLLATAALL
jgi:hypothetical protein